MNGMMIDPRRTWDCDQGRYVTDCAHADPSLKNGVLKCDDCSALRLAIVPDGGNWVRAPRLTYRDAFAASREAFDYGFRMERRATLLAWAFGVMCALLLGSFAGQVW